MDSLWVETTEVLRNGPLNKNFYQWDPKRPTLVPYGLVLYTSDMKSDRCIWTVVHLQRWKMNKQINILRRQKALKQLQLNLGRITISGRQSIAFNRSMNFQSTDPGKSPFPTESLHRLYSIAERLRAAIWWKTRSEHWNCDDNGAIHRRYLLFRLIAHRLHLTIEKRCMFWLFELLKRYILIILCWIPCQSKEKKLSCQSITPARVSWRGLVAKPLAVVSCTEKLKFTYVEKIKGL